MAHSIKSISFIPPYVFSQLSRVDKENSELWKKCASQARKVIRQRAQEPVTSFSKAKYSQRSSSSMESKVYSPRVTVISKDEKIHPDLDAKNAKENGVVTLQFLWDCFGRKSFDNQGSRLTIYVHDNDVPNNAQWYDDDTIHVGDSNTPEYTTPATDPDIMGHETGHGVVKYTAQFRYKEQSGALNESWADACGSMVKQYKLGQTANKADWLIGDEFIKDIGRVQALRSMKAPGTAYEFDENNKDLQVDHMAKYIETKKDSGGVHLNSGIPNKAFYLFAMTFPDRNSWEIAGQIWYKSLSFCNSTTTFLEFAEINVKVSETYKSNLPSEEIVMATCRSWNAVGILTSKYALRTERFLPQKSVPEYQEYLSKSNRKQMRYVAQSDEEDVGPNCFCQ